MTAEKDGERDTTDDVSRMRRHRTLFDELAELVARGELDPARLDLAELEDMEQRRCCRTLWCGLNRGHFGPCELEREDR